MLDDKPLQQQSFKPQGTQIYKLIGDLMDIVAKRYKDAPKASRNLTMNTLWVTLAKMAGDYCMGFTCKEPNEKLAYFNRLRCNYYSVEAMFGRLVTAKIISEKMMGNLALTKLNPLIKQITGLANKVKC